jgi:hypothetical protein
MGQTVSSLRVIKKIDEMDYEIQVPIPNPEFESYVARISPSSGVCRVSGLGKTHTNDRYGFETRSAFARLKASLGARYGSSKNYDFLNAGSIWNDPQDWHMALQKEERTLASFWSKEHESALPATISGIMLDTRAVSSGPYLALAYEFTNMTDCSARKQAQEEAGL